MKILILSNYFNHHQASLCDALWRQTGGAFRFLETMPMPLPRKELGYPQWEREYVIRYWEQKPLALEWIREAEVVIAGSAPENLVRQRILRGKLLLRCEERPLKKGMEIHKYLPRLLRWHWRNPPGKPIYLLCASAYTARDYANFFLFQNRAYRWGYFPETRRYASVELLLARKDPRQILWCGRLLDWKHPDNALAAARRLKMEGYAFCLTFLGGGEREQILRQKAAAYGLEDCVRFSGTCGPEQVRNAMEQAGIFLFTSGRREGWGAVMNEAMNSGCAVVGSRDAGAVPWLIQDGVNGLTYSAGDVDGLYEKVKYLLDHPGDQKRLGRMAYQTILKLWNGEVAAQRLTALAGQILAGNPHPCRYLEGPCSLAERGQP